MIAMQGLLMKRSKLEPGKLIIWGSSLLVVSFAVMLVFKALPLYYIAYFLFGVGVGMIMPGFMTGASLAVSADQQGSVAGLIGMGQGFAAVVAPLLSTGLYSIDRHLPFVFAALLMIVLVGIVLGSSVSKRYETKQTD
jgi:MFS family permease